MNKTAENIVKGICGALALGLLITNDILSNDVTYITNSDRCSYSKAIKAISDSDTMWSKDKALAIEKLPSDKDEGFYKAIIAIVNSDMWSREKVEAIESIINNS